MGVGVPVWAGGARCGSCGGGRYHRVVEGGVGGGANHLKPWHQTPSKRVPRVVDHVAYLLPTSAFNLAGRSPHNLDTRHLFGKREVVSYWG